MFYGILGVVCGFGRRALGVKLRGVELFEDLKQKSDAEFGVEDSFGLYYPKP